MRIFRRLKFDMITPRGLRAVLLALAAVSAVAVVAAGLALITAADREQAQAFATRQQQFDDAFGD